MASWSRWRAICIARSSPTTSMSTAWLNCKGSRSSISTSWQIRSNPSCCLSRPSTSNLCRMAENSVSAGTSRRMQGHAKLWMPLAGRLTLARTIDIFDASRLVDRIVLIVHAERITDAAALCQQEGWRKIVGIVTGGPRRQDSVRIGLDALAKIAPGSQWVMIQAGARPLVTPALLEPGLIAAQEHQAAI